MQRRGEPNRGINGCPQVPGNGPCWYCQNTSGNPSGTSRRRQAQQSSTVESSDQPIIRVAEMCAWMDGMSWRQCGFRRGWRGNCNRRGKRHHKALVPPRKQFQRARKTERVDRIWPLKEVPNHPDRRLVSYYLGGRAAGVPVDFLGSHLQLPMQNPQQRLGWWGCGVKR